MFCPLWLSGFFFHPYLSMTARHSFLQVNLLPRLRRKPPGAGANGGGVWCHSITSSRARGAARMASVAPVAITNGKPFGPLFMTKISFKCPTIHIMMKMKHWCWRVVLPGFVFSSWYQRKKARFFCSLRSEPCCRSQWEIRLWLIPKRWRAPCHSMGLKITGLFVFYCETHLWPEQPQPERSVCWPGKTWPPLWSPHYPSCNK